MSFQVPEQRGTRKLNIDFLPLEGLKLKKKKKKKMCRRLSLQLPGALISSRRLTINGPEHQNKETHSSS
jgi:hypothetical protein